jgi:long-subunit acyl-CoA synthetase (AMP-forming)
VAEGEGGEIFVKGPCMMLGYIDNPEASAEAFADGGWLSTGDYGHKADGKIFFSGRKKDIIKVNAYQVSPAEVEARLKQHHSIKDAAVIGIEGASCKGDLVRAYIVVREGTEFQEGEIRSYLREHLSSYEIPAEFEPIDSIPKSPTGKIERRQLKEKASEELQPVQIEDLAERTERASTVSSTSTVESGSTSATSSDDSVQKFGSVSSEDSVPLKEPFVSETPVSAKESGIGKKSSSPWRHAIGQKTSKTRSIASRTLARLLSWLRALLK